MDKLIETEEHENEEPAEAPETASSETEPREADRDTNGGESNWLMRAVLILVAAGLIVGLIFLARWIYHETSGNKPSPSQSQSSKGGKTASGNNNPIVVGGGQSGNSQKSTATKPKATQTLPNNGPGNVIGVFAAATFAAGALHYIVSLRKTARED